MAKKSFKIEYFILATFVLIVFVLLLNSKNICEGFYENKKYSLEYYYMDGCGHCDQFNESGIWEKLEKNHYDKCDFKKYNMKDNMDRIKKFDIQGFPTILLVDKSDNKDKMVKAFEDARTYTNLERFINNI
jgi:hypothetical protein